MIRSPFLLAATLLLFASHAQAAACLNPTDWLDHDDVVAFEGRVTHATIPRTTLANDGTREAAIVTLKVTHAIKGVRKDASIPVTVLYKPVDNGEAPRFIIGERYYLAVTHTGNRYVSGLCSYRRKLEHEAGR